MTCCRNDAVSSPRWFLGGQALVFFSRPHSSSAVAREGDAKEASASSGQQARPQLQDCRGTTNRLTPQGRLAIPSRKRPAGRQLVLAWTATHPRRKDIQWACTDERLWPHLGEGHEPRHGSEQRPDCLRRDCRWRCMEEHRRRRDLGDHHGQCAEPRHRCIGDRRRRHDNLRGNR